MMSASQPRYLLISDEGVSNPTGKKGTSCVHLILHWFQIPNFHLIPQSLLGSQMIPLVECAMFTCCCCRTSVQSGEEMSLPRGWSSGNNEPESSSDSDSGILRCSATTLFFQSWGPQIVCFHCSPFRILLWLLYWSWFSREAESKG